MNRNEKLKKIIEEIKNDEDEFNPEEAKKEDDKKEKEEQK